MNALNFKKLDRNELKAITGGYEKIIWTWIEPEEQNPCLNCPYRTSCPSQSNDSGNQTEFLCPYGN